MKLRPYQRNLVKKTKEALSKGYRFPCIVAPAGSGKTVIISDIVKSATTKKNNVLFLVHRQELLEQVEKTLIENNVDMNYVKLGMVQSIVNRLDETTYPQLIIVDESHHAPSNSYRKIFDYFDKSFRVSFTATPIRFGGAGLGDVNDVIIEDVDVQFLIENEYLADFRYFAPRSIDTSDLDIKGIADFSDQSIDEAISKSKIYGDAIKHYKELVDGEQAIAYCHSVLASENAAKAFNDAGIISAHVHGDTPKIERQRIIKEFRDGNIKVLTNVDIIGEGFDVPECSVVIMLRPTKSLSLFIQQSMRGMRYKHNKVATIIDHVNNKELHGYPNTPREWSLEGLVKKEQQNELTAKQCDKCFYNYEPEYKRCPNCGYESPIKEREDYEVIEEAELEEVDTSITLDFDKVIKKTANDCKNMQELHDLAKERNYKPGFAYINGKRLGFIK